MPAALLSALVRLASALAGLVPVILARTGGRDAARAAAAKTEMEGVRRANAARDRLCGDPDHAGRLRARFTRSER